eukprot:sb/3468167/
MRDPFLPVIQQSSVTFLLSIMILDYAVYLLHTLTILLVSIIWLRRRYNHGNQDGNHGNHDNQDAAGDPGRGIAPDQIASCSVEEDDDDLDYTAIKHDSGGAVVGDVYHGEVSEITDSLIADSGPGEDIGVAPTYSKSVDVTGNHGDDIGNYGDVTGNHGDVTGNHCNITGNHGDVSGNHGNITGNHGDVTGNHGDVSGNHGDVIGNHGDSTEVDGVELTSPSKPLDLNSLAFVPLSPNNKPLSHDSGSSTINIRQLLYVFLNIKLHPPFS